MDLRMRGRDAELEEDDAEEQEQEETIDAEEQEQEEAIAAEGEEDGMNRDFIAQMQDANDWDALIKYIVEDLWNSDSDSLEMKEEFLGRLYKVFRAATAEHCADYIEGADYDEGWLNNDVVKGTVEGEEGKGEELNRDYIDELWDSGDWNGFIEHVLDCFNCNILDMNDAPLGHLYKLFSRSSAQACVDYIQRK